MIAPQPKGLSWEGVCHNGRSQKDCIYIYKDPVYQNLISNGIQVFSVVNVDIKFDDMLWDIIVHS